MVFKNPLCIIQNLMDSLVLLKIALGVAMEGEEKESNSLNLYGCNFDSVTGLDLADLFRTNSTITYLNLTYARLSYSNVQSFADALKSNTTLSSLVFAAGKESGDDSTQTLADMLKTNSTLTYLDLGASAIGDEGITSLADALVVNSTLISLNLAYNNWGDGGLQAMAKMLKTNTALAYLNLDDNVLADEMTQLTNKSVMALGNALAVNTTLTSLSLCRIRLGVDGALALGQALSANTTLTYLNISFNDFGDSGVLAVADALTMNNTLTSLDIGVNDIGDAGFKALARALTVNNSITTLRGDFWAEQQGATERFDRQPVITNRLKHNFRLLECWASLAPLLSFLRANAGNEIVRSVYPMLPVMREYLGCGVAKDIRHLSKVSAFADTSFGVSMIQQGMLAVPHFDHVVATEWYSKRPRYDDASVVVSKRRK